MHKMKNLNNYDWMICIAGVGGRAFSRTHAAKLTAAAKCGLRCLRLLAKAMSGRIRICWLQRIVSQGTELL